MRRNDLEKKDFHIVIVDVVLNVKVRIINVYRSFSPPNSMTPEAFFAEQLKILKKLSASACALISCLMVDSYDVSFINLHKTHMKCTPDQIMLYQIALRLHKLVNDHSNVLSFEHVTVMDQIICTRRQIKFQILRKFNHKIGLNTTANKFYHLNNLISLDSLNLNFVHYKKIMKIQFLKNGRT